MKEILFRLNEKKTLMLLVLNLHEVFYVLKITQFKFDWFKQLILLLLFIGKNKIMLQCHVCIIGFTQQRPKIKIILKFKDYLNSY